MTVERYIDPEAYEAVMVAARDAYRRAAQLVAPRLTTGLVAAAGQALSEAEWLDLTADVADAYGDVYLDALIQAGADFSNLPSDSTVVSLLESQASGLNDLVGSVRSLLDVFVDSMIESAAPADTFLDQLLDAPSSPLNPRKAEALARTATTAAANAGFSASFKAAMVPAVSWITRRDDRVREAHVAVDRDVVMNGGYFQVGGFEAKYPGDPSLPIGLRINCRCMLGWVDGDQVKRTVSAKKTDLYSMARQLEIPRRSRMTKAELQLAVVKSLCLQGLAAGPDCPDTLADQNMATLLVHARLGNIRGRYRMRRSELLAAVQNRFQSTGPNTRQGFATAPAPVDRITALDDLADDVVNGLTVNVPADLAADLIEILGRHTEPVDLTLVHADDVLFGSVASNVLARADMPQIPEDFIDEFAAFLRSEGVTLDDIAVAPLDVFATQNELDARKVGKMITAIRNGQFTPEHPAFVSSDDRILDGHHRWAARAALELAGDTETMPVLVASVGIDKLLDYADRFAESKGIESKSHGMAWNPNQPRVPAGSQGGGRFAPKYSASGRPIFMHEPGERGSVWEPGSMEDIQRAKDERREYDRSRAVVDYGSDREEMRRHRDTFAKGVKSVFPDGASDVAPVPFQAAATVDGEDLIDQAVVDNYLSQPVRLSNFDPRSLYATEPTVTRQGVEHYLEKSGGRPRDSYAMTGALYGDADEAGNQHPVIYRNPQTEELVIVSGHHRAAAALVEGRNLSGIFVDPRVQVFRQPAELDPLPRFRGPTGRATPIVPRKRPRRGFWGVD